MCFSPLPLIIFAGILRYLPVHVVLEAEEKEEKKGNCMPGINDWTWGNVYQEWEPSFMSSTDILLFCQKYDKTEFCKQESLGGLFLIQPHHSQYTAVQRALKHSPWLKGLSDSTFWWTIILVVGHGYSASEKGNPQIQVYISAKAEENFM